MRQALLLAPMMCLALLTACGSAKRYEESFSLWREEFVAAESRTIEAEVTAISPESETVFTLTLSAAPEKDTVTILLPEYLKNVSAETDGETAQLHYDGVVLDLGSAAEETSPMTALPLLMSFLREGHLQSVWTEEHEGRECIVAELEDAEARRMQLWIETDTMQPRLAAIRRGDETELKINILKTN